MPYATITVHFWGICTFMQAQQQIGVPASGIWGNRMVLPNASDPSTFPPQLQGLGIHPHFAEMQICVQDLITISDTESLGFTTTPDPIFIPQPANPPFYTWRLNNVILSIANPVPGPPPTNPGFFQMRDFVEGAPLPLPNLDATLIPVAGEAACYFDFFSGDLRAVRTHVAPPENAAVIGELTVVTLGNPQIRVRSFTDPTAVVTIELQSGAHVVVGNGPQTSADDQPQDWFLHYLSCSTFPNQISIPSATIGIPPIVTYNPPRWDSEMMLTIGCSNSSYP